MMNTEVNADIIPGFIFSVLSEYGLDRESVSIKEFGNGLINRTWKVSGNHHSYILQRINDKVFSSPEFISWNLELIEDYLKDHAPDYLFIAPIRSRQGKMMVHLEAEGYFRMLPFVADSYTKNVVATPQQAYQAAAGFGKFTRLLSGFDAKKLKPTIPHFHDLSLRYREFLKAAVEGNRIRIAETRDFIQQLNEHSGIVSQYEELVRDPGFRLRVMHHDTKISNILFNINDQAICVIDLDTLMPGYFISDLGDIMRTYLSPVDEEEMDVGKIEIRKEFYEAVVQGYSEEMGGVLTPVETRFLGYAGSFMMYMQALRFMTDYLNDDIYYGARYEKHNLVRARNQAILLEKFEQFISVQLKSKN
jgi:Ser/Thr protein kinase RdoA (MazF antagonist)